MKDYVPSYPNPDDDDRPEWEKKLRPLFSAAEDKDGEGARPSSLIPACNMPDPGLGYELMLMRELKIINEQTVRELGPLPKGGLPGRKKTKPNVPYRDFRGNLVPEVSMIEESDEMKLRQIAAAVALATGVSANAYGEGGSQAIEGKGQKMTEVTAALADAMPGIRQKFLTCSELEPWSKAAECIGEERTYQDARLNRIYRELTGLLDTNARERLVVAQRVWIGLQEKDGAFEAAIFDSLGQVGYFEEGSSEVIRICARANQLEKYLHSIKSERRTYKMHGNNP